jgi:serine/threonine-protein kinase
VFAAPFDLDRLEMTGQQVPVLEGVQASTGTGGAQIAVSTSGTLVYLAGGEISIEASMSWLDRGGRTTPLRASASDWSNPSFSPDGRRVAFDVVGAGGGAPDVWVYEWSRDTPTKLTFDPGPDVKPVWTPDGRRIVFTSGRSLYWRRADGSGDVQRLTDSGNLLHLASSWHPSGKFLAFSEQNSKTGYDILILPVDGDETSGWKIGKAAVFLNSPASEQEPMFSPDGRWLAYYSNESGRQEVYVRPFPGPGGQQVISNDGGTFPAWSRTTSELFYNDFTTNQMMVAPYTSAGESLRVDKPRVWSPGRLIPRPRLRPFALHPDGKRVAIASAEDPRTAARPDKVVFIFNFFDELRRLAPPK